MTGGYYDSTDREMRTRILQRMLRALAESDVRESGQYDEATREAVRRFQRMRGYPATGIADRRTWEEMSRLYRERETDARVEGIRPFVGRERRIYPRERSDLVMILQLILNELRVRYDGFGPIPLSGIYDEMTEEAVREFQRINLLPTDGITDARTWNRMARQYNDVLTDRRQ
ncbi:MAG: peptidoglycan-binding protein [Clostridia bacterium]|nr:peptidoglycan-binding protein [Clostridia bacterium]